MRRGIAITFMFGKKKYIPIKATVEPRNDIVPGLGQSCTSCGKWSTLEELSGNYRVCPRCNWHLALSARQRIEMLCDPHSFEELDADMVSSNRLNFPGYEHKLAQAREESGLPEAIVTGRARLGGYQVVLGVMDSYFMMGSMGVVVGEKVCRAVEVAIENESPLIIFSCSGGARMQEGIFSLLQMAKTAAVLERFHQKGYLYISVLTNPTTGGVLASFASLADIIISEPGALLGFTGPRVIKQTIGERLPENFQQAGFLLDHGMLDLVVERNRLREQLILLLKLHQGGEPW